MENFSTTNEVFTVDLSSTKTPADIVFELSQLLDDTRAFNKKIYLKLANIDLSKSQLLSLKSLISSINSTLDYIESDSVATIAAAQSIAIETPNHAPLNPALNQQAEQSQAPIMVDFSTTTESGASPIIQDVGFQVSAEENLAGEEIKMPEFPKFEDADQENSIENENFSAENAQVEQVSSIDNVEVSQEQVLEDFAPRMTSAQERFKEADEYFKDRWNEASQEDADGLQLGNFSDETTEDGSELPSSSQQHFEFAPEGNVLENIEPSVELEDIADSTNAQSEDIHKALDDIFESEQKLKDILSDTEREEQTTIDLTQLQQDKPVYTEDDALIDKMPTKYVKQTIRSGMVISSDGNLVVIGDCHPGSEIHAAGDITVWGLLGGIAHAGCKGNKKAKVRALKLNPIQLRIANLYSRRPDSLHTIYMEKTSTFVPEEAKILNDEIVIYTMNEK